jgi:hypothetical protein
MANIYLPLPVPAADGIGAIVDTSAIGARRTLVVTGTPFRGTVTLQGSNDGVVWAPIAAFQNPGEKTMEFSVQFMRVKLAGFNPTYYTPPEVQVGGVNLGGICNFLAVLAGAGPAASTNITDDGHIKSILVGGTYRGGVVIEISNDDVEFVPVATFAPGQSKIRTIRFYAKYIRTRRINLPTINVGLPVVSVCSADDPSSGASPVGPFLSHWNTADGSNGDQTVTESIGRTTARVSTPNGGEGSPYNTNGWAGTNQPTVDQVAAPTVNFTTPGNTTGWGGTSDMDVTVYDADGTTVLDSFTAPIAGNGVQVSGSGFLTVTTTGFGPDGGTRFQAKVNVAVSYAAILTNAGLTGGRFHVECIQNTDPLTDGNGPFTYTQPDVYADANPTTPSIGGTPNTHSLDLEASSSQEATIADGAQTGLDFSGTITFEGWVKLESTGNRVIIGRWGNIVASRAYRFLLTSTTLQLSLSSDGSSVSSASVLFTAVAGTWYHVAVTWDPSTGDTKFYVDGSQQGLTQNIAIASIFNTAGPFRVGNDETSTAFMDGKIDELRVWSVVRSVTDINNNKSKQISGATAGLQGYWRFNNDYTDQTANGNTLTPAGGPVFSTDVPFATVTLVETGGGVLTKHLSGLEYYILGSSFTVDIGEIDQLNRNSQRQPTNLRLVGSDYGVFGLDQAPFGAGAADFSGWSNDNDVDDVGYSKNDYDINIINHRYMAPNASVGATPRDPFGDGPTVDSPGQSILVDSYPDPAPNTSDQREPFDDETRREFIDGVNGAASGGSFPGAGAWPSSTALATVGGASAMVFNGKLWVPRATTNIGDGIEAANADWSAFKPDVGGANPDYTALAGENYGRRFLHPIPATNTPSFQIVFAGTFAAGNALSDILSGNLEFYIYRISGSGNTGAPPGNTNALRLHVSYNFALFDDGATVPGSGILLGSSAANTIDGTFGGLPAQDGIYFHVRLLNDATQIDDMQITFN